MVYFSDNTIKPNNRLIEWLFWPWCCDSSLAKYTFQSTLTTIVVAIFNFFCFPRFLTMHTRGGWVGHIVQLRRSGARDSSAICRSFYNLTNRFDTTPNTASNALQLAATHCNAGPRALFQSARSLWRPCSREPMPTSGAPSTSHMQPQNGM